MDGPRLEIANWLLGVLVLAVGVVIPLGIAASRNKLLQQAIDSLKGKVL